jgi:hypothetical protein
VLARAPVLEAAHVRGGGEEGGLAALHRTHALLLTLRLRVRVRVRGRGGVRIRGRGRARARGRGRVGVRAAHALLVPGGRARARLRRVHAGGRTVDGGTWVALG